MTALLLAALLFSTPFPTDKDKGDKDKGDGEEPRATALMRHTPDYPLRYQPGQRGKLYFNVGYGVVRNYFDDGGDFDELGDFGALGNREGEITELAVHAGGAYDVGRVGDLGLAIGVDVAFAEIASTSEPVEGLPSPLNLEADVTSGFTAQNVTVFGELMAPNYRLRAGFIYDLGPEIEFEPSATVLGGTRDNTDEQDAILLGAAFQYPTEAARLFAGADYFLTLEGESDPFGNLGGDVQYDYGDILNLHAGVGFPFGSASEIGVTVLYRINTEGDVEGLGLDDVDQPDRPSQFRSGNLLSVVPYVTFAQPEANVQFYLKGAVQREYHDYGFSILGENDFAPRIGGTLGVVYGF